jgi:small conductance mechanosensitive channel
VDLVFGIGYEDDLQKAKRILEEIVGADERVLDDPPVSVVVMELADSSVNLAARAWVQNADWWATRCDLIERVKLRFDQEGISIPYPQRDVHIIGEQPLAAA